MCCVLLVALFGMYGMPPSLDAGIYDFTRRCELLGLIHPCCDGQCILLHKPLVVTRTKPASSILYPPLFPDKGQQRRPKKTRPMDNEVNQMLYKTQLCLFSAISSSLFVFLFLLTVLILFFLTPYNILLYLRFLFS